MGWSEIALWTSFFFKLPEKARFPLELWWNIDCIWNEIWVRKLRNTRENDETNLVIPCAGNASKTLNTSTDFNIFVIAVEILEACRYVRCDCEMRKKKFLTVFMFTFGVVNKLRHSNIFINHQLIFYLQITELVLCYVFNEQPQMTVSEFYLFSKSDGSWWFLVHPCKNSHQIQGTASQILLCCLAQLDLLKSEEKTC